MQITNLATVSVDNTAGGTDILTAAQARIATTLGMYAVIIEPSVAIALVDAGGASPTSTIPGSIVGTAANSAAKCNANEQTTVTHAAGSLRAISTAGASTVKVTVLCAP